MNNFDIYKEILTMNHRKATKKIWKSKLITIIKMIQINALDRLYLMKFTNEVIIN